MGWSQGNKRPNCPGDVIRHQLEPVGTAFLPIAPQGLDVHPVAILHAQLANVLGMDEHHAALAVDPR